MTNLLTATPAEFCAATNACEEGREFAMRHATMAEVWDACPRSDWLLWVARRVDRVPDDRTLRLFAVWCARHTPIEDGRVTGDLITDPRSIAALEVAEKYANGQATAGELTAAYARATAADWTAAYATAAARAAARAAAADWTAVAAAAHAAAHAAAARAAAADWTAVAAAAHAAAHAAAADWTTRSSYAAHDAASRAQADQFRRMVPNPFRA